MTEQEARNLKSQIESQFPRLGVAVREPINPEFQDMFYLAVRARQTDFFSAIIINSASDWEQTKEVAAIVAAQPVDAATHTRRKARKHMAKYRFGMNDGLSPIPSEIETALGKDNIENLDPWNRGIVEISDAQAATLAQLVEQHNDDCPTDTISFRPATGTEYTISVSVSNGKSTSWQW